MIRSLPYPSTCFHIVEVGSAPPPVLHPNLPWTGMISEGTQLRRPGAGGLPWTPHPTPAPSQFLLDLSPAFIYTGLGTLKPRKQR